ncbi:hypothetical protein [Acidocella aquatica]|nr:hypothetical protein [Acidocella aquatica]
MMRGLALASLVPLGAAPARAEAALALLVAGPDGEQTSRWGNACALAMQAGFPGAPSIITQAVGGLDGVTGANRLDALVVPDGKTAVILPGAALIAWLTGDSRVHFDPTRWVPLMAGGNSGVLVVRLPSGAAPDLKTLQSLAPLKLAADQPQSNDLAVLLALARLGVPTAPVFGLRGTDAKITAFTAGQVDAVFLCGEGVPEDIAPLTASGGVPVFSLGLQNADGTISPDPAFPSLPDATALGPSVSPFLDTAYRAAAAAARLDFIMVLPRLTDPGSISQWRQAASEALAAPALVAAASASSITLQSAPAVIAGLTALNLAPADQADMQAFLTKNFGWQPG